MWPGAPELDNEGLNSSSNDQAPGTGLVLQAAHSANCPQHQTGMEHSVLTGSFPAALEEPGTEKLANTHIKG